MRISQVAFAPEQTNFVRDFIERPGHRYVYGRTHEGASIAGLIGIDGFIDDFTSDTTFLNLPCMKIDDVPRGARIVSTVVQAHAISAMNNLARKNFQFIDYFAFKKISGLPLREIPYWAGAETHFDAHQQDYHNVYDDLADAQSKDVFDRILNFRLNHDLREMAVFTANLKGMYFEPFLKLPEQNAIFFDVGSYDGYNSEHFYRLYPGMHMAFLFEPLPVQAELLKKKYPENPRFTVVDYACSDEDGMVKFSVDSTASHLSRDGQGIDIRTIRIDTFCERHQVQPDLIKMDIEGAELKALDGAVRTIAACKPNLAISVYHDVSHLTRAYELISRLHPSYNFYLRHYTEGYTETVLFAVP